MPWANRQQAFTAVELIVSLVVLAVLVTGTIRYIGHSAEGYVNAAQIMAVTSGGRVALARMTREIRASVPNSVRVGVDRVDQCDESGGNCIDAFRCIEFLPMVQSTSFLDLGNIDDKTVPNEALDFPSAEGLLPGTTCDLALGGIDCSKFSVVVPAGLPFNPAPDYVAVAPETPDELYSGDSQRMFPFVSITPAFRGSEASTNIYDIEKGVWPAPPGAGAQELFEKQPISQRMFFVADPVSYCVSDGSATGTSSGELRRYQGYGLPAAIGEPDAAFSVVMTDGLTNLDVFTNKNEDKAIFGMKLEFEVSDQDPELTLDHEIQVRNSP